MIEPAAHFTVPATLAPPLRWYVLAILGGLERVAKMHLDEAGIETFLPLVETERKSKPRGRAPELPYIVVPRFPGYLFVRLSAGDPRWGILGSDERPRGVLHALATEEGRPIPVPDKQIERWLAMADKDGIVEHWTPPPSPRRWYDPGEMVKVNCGPYLGWVGVVESQDRGNVRVVMAAKPVKLRWDQIEPVG